MANSWKEWERIVARKIFGDRRGAYTGGVRGGKTDIIHPILAAECKLLKAPTVAAVMEACRQAEDNAEPGQVPIAFVKRKGDIWADGLVVMRMEVFSKWLTVVKKAAEDEDDGIREASEQGN